MATRNPLPNRSQFIRDEFARDAASTPKTIIDAWKAAGGAEEISPSLVYMVKGKNKPALVSNAKASAAPRASIATTLEPQKHSGGYEVIEAGLDEMIRASFALQDDALASRLRVARRLVSRELID